jgi:hypothetical protein
MDAFDRSRRRFVQTRHDVSLRPQFSFIISPPASLERRRNIFLLAAVTQLFEERHLYLPIIYNMSDDCLRRPEVFVQRAVNASELS